MSMLPIWANRAKEAETITNGTAAYSSAVVGGLLTFTGFARNREGDISGGYISDVYLTDADNLQASLDLYLFRDAPTAIADGDPLTLTVEEALAKCFAVVSISSYTAILKTGGGTIGWAHVDSLQHEFGANADGNIYGYLYGSPDSYTNTDALRVLLNGFTY